MLLAAALAGLALGSMAARGLYGVALDGRVTRVEVRHEKRPPVDDVHLLHVGRGAIHVDARLAREVDAGDRVRKARTERVLRVDGRAVRLDPSRDLRRSLVAMPLMLLLVVALLLVPRPRGA